MTMTTIDRRRMLAAGSALIGAVALGHGATRAQDATPAATPVGGVDPVTGAWSFTDDKGVTVTLPARPERLVIDVNAAAPLWDYGIRPVGLFGWNVDIDGTLGDAGGNIDPAQVELVGDVNERLRVEEAVALDPDLIITITFSPDDPAEYWSFDPDILEQVQSQFPIIALSATGSADRGVERYVELALALGADLSTPEIEAARAGYEAAIAATSAAAAARADLDVLFGYFASTELYFASAQDWNDLTFYASLGLNILSVGAPAGEYWTQVSAEEFGTYPSDVLFRSTRGGTLTTGELEADPVFGLHPAVAAGQVFDWNQDVILSYQGMTTALEAIRSAIESSTKVT